MKEKNPIKIMSVMILVLLVAVIIVVLFVPQKSTTGERIGYFLKEDEATTAAEPQTQTA